MKLSHVKLMHWLNVLLHYLVLFSQCSYSQLPSFECSVCVVFPDNGMGEENMVMKGKKDLGGN